MTAGTTSAGLVLAAVPLVVAGSQGAPAAPSAETAGDLVLVAKKGNRKIKRYRVRPGDTATSVAVRYHAWTDELIKRNGRILYVGEVIRIPVVLSAQRACTRHRHHHTNVGRHGHHAHAQPGKKPHKPRHHKPNRGPRKDHRYRHLQGWHHAGASQGRVRQVVAAKARRHGVNPDLALAIAWQESGWQHDQVSSAGALGAMQIMPGTGRWISDVVGRRLNPRDLLHNAFTGVRLIRILRAEARQRIAIAGYYQGLAGVRRHGMYASTKRYVANVLAIKRRIAAGRPPA